MRRWNGWGDDRVNYPLNPGAIDYLERHLGQGNSPLDVDLNQVLGAVPASRLDNHPLVSLEAKDRILHARGQSFPDWVAMRSGRIGQVPDGVVFPTCDEDVVHSIRFAKESGAVIIPYGGGTSVVGHINPSTPDYPVLSIDLTRMNRLRYLDEKGLLATFDAGITGSDLEAHLRAKGFTLGHYPQSFEYSTLGGWIATRSSGQQSMGYGRIEALFAGGTVETPEGRMDLPVFPASAAGPDLKQIILGSEGRFGIITSAVVRITPLPAREDFHAVFFPSWESGFEAVQKIVQSNLNLSMLRYSTPAETITTLQLAGHENLIGILERLLRMRGVKEEKCMLLIGFWGNDSVYKAVRRETLEIAGSFGGVHVGRTFGDQWHKSRFRTPYLRNTLWELGYGIDTLETALPWSRVDKTIHGIVEAIENAASSEGENVHVFSHLSHLYPIGSSIYTTYLFRLKLDLEKTLEMWRKMKEAASRVIVENQGTISHQHGVGLDHAVYLAAEKGEIGMEVLRGLCHQMDPDGLMNPGKLVESHRLFSTP
jgi:alkyldihydroxyacetonephosphate synthase